MKIIKIPKPWDYRATCEALFKIMEPYFSEYKFTKTHSLTADRPFITIYVSEIIKKSTGSWFFPAKSEERLIARFMYFPMINNKIETHINESDFTDTFKEKLSKIEEVCQNKIVFEVNVKEGL